MRYLFALLLSALGAGCYPQDVMTLKTGDEQTVKVIEVGTSEITYRKFDNPDGPVYTIPKQDVFMIKYKNGNKDVFNLQPATNKEQNNFTNAFEIKSKGYCGIAEVGTNILVNNSANYPMFSFLFFNGARLSKDFSIGFETGIATGTQVGFIIPATLSMRANFVRKRVSPFFEFNAGFNYINTDQNYFPYYYNYSSSSLIGAAFSVSVGMKVWIVKEVAVSIRGGYNGYMDTDTQGDWHIINGIPFMCGVEF